MMSASAVLTRSDGPSARGTRSDYLAGTDPQLEWSLFLPSGEPVSPLTLVLVHGASHQKVCYENWAVYLQQQGWRIITLSLRGHGGSRWSRPIGQAHLSDYVEDIRQVVMEAGIGEHIVLVGHSMGGWVAQLYAETYDLAGLIVLDSVSPQYSLRGQLHLIPTLLREDPLIYFKCLRDLGALFSTERLVRKLLLSPDADADLVQRCRAQLGPESGNVFKEVPALAFRQHAPLRARHILFLAGDQDRCCRPKWVQASARSYGGAAVFKHGPHNLMMDGDWQGAAEEVLRFARQCSRESEAGAGEDRPALSAESGAGAAH